MADDDSGKNIIRLEDYWSPQDILLISQNGDAITTTHYLDKNKIDQEAVYIYSDSLIMNNQSLFYIIAIPLHFVSISLLICIVASLFDFIHTPLVILFSLLVFLLIICLLLYHLTLSFFNNPHLFNQ